MRKVKILFPVLMLAAALAGCAKPLLYQWGSYEEQVYTMYSDPGKISPEEQLQHLEQDYQAARSANRPVPPGYHAHVGYLYFQLGKADQALQSFETEKALFPESTVYMDRLIARIKH
ncbi:MAG TPA: DUF4810 domain-containing protein [Nitrospirota bacterium]|nr:DUF4810 domain-containing protein [Nitrospirota bacterium]